MKHARKEVDSTKTAIVLIDDNNDFLSEHGKLYGAVKEVLERNQVIPNINDLVNEARAKGATIVHVPIVFSADYREMGDEPYGIFKVVEETGAFQRNTWGAKVADVLDVHDGDIVVDNKSTTCAFATTKLDEVLDEHGITYVVLAGLLTNICVETTMRTAYDKGYKVYAITDCSATIDNEQQEASIKNNWPMFSMPLDHQDFLNQLEGATI